MKAQHRHTEQSDKILPALHERTVVHTWSVSSSENVIAVRRHLIFNKYWLMRKLRALVSWGFAPSWVRHKKGWLWYSIATFSQTRRNDQLFFMTTKLITQITRPFELIEVTNGFFFSVNQAPQSIGKKKRKKRSRWYISDTRSWQQSIASFKYNMSSTSYVHSTVHRPGLSLSPKSMKKKKESASSSKSTRSPATYCLSTAQTICCWWMCGFAWWLWFPSKNHHWNKNQLFCLPWAWSKFCFASSTKTFWWIK